MTRGKPLMAIVLILVVVGVVAITQLSPAQTVDDDTAPVASKQVVAAVAAESITEYEPDPFEPQRLRSSTVRVRRVALIYADGTIEVQPVGK